MLFWSGRAAARVRRHPMRVRKQGFFHSTGAGRQEPSEAVMLMKKKVSHEGNEFESTANEEFENYGDEEVDDEELLDDEDLEDDEEFEDEDSDLDEDFEDDGYEDNEELEEFEEGNEER